MFNKRSGQTMVEAAVVLPIVILSVVAIVYILSFMYSEVAESAKTHVASNAEMGKETGVSITNKHIPRNVSVSKSSSGLGSVYHSSGTVRFRKKGLFQKSFTKRIESTTYEVDEKKLIRYTDIFK